MEHSNQGRPRKGIGRVVIIAAILIITVIYLIPFLWIISTSIKPFKEITSVPPKVFFRPDLTNYIKLFTTRTQLREELSPREIEESTWYERKIYDLGQRIIGPSKYLLRVFNSLIIAGLSTLFAVTLGTLSAYGYSRFEVRGKQDWLFFILSTRMLPPIVVTIPIFLMYRFLGLNDTRFGLILLYTVFNVSFAVWVMKSIIDEIPTEYEEAAMVDGYTRFEAFRKIVLPQAATGIAATAVFCFIFAWNEYVFALILSMRRAQTAPPFIPSQIGTGMIEWGVIAAGATLFLIPVAVFTFFLRSHLLRGITFGAIRK
jgi:multiple sugar transport system permease protein